MPASAYSTLEHFAFGDSPAMADELLTLVLQGKKTATCWPASQGLKGSAPGARYVVLDGAGAPRVVIESTELVQRRFHEVPADFAAAVRLPRQGRWRLALAGLCAGLALGAKWSIAVAIALPGLAFLLMRLWQHRARFLWARQGAPEYGEGPGAHFANERDQLDANEFFEAEQSRIEDSLDILEVGPHTQTAAETRRLTSDGFVTERSTTLLRTNYGRIINRDQLTNGGRCSECGQYADASSFFVCAVCGVGLCPLHVHTLETIPLCRIDFRRVLHCLDMWRRP